MITETPLMFAAKVDQVQKKTSRRAMMPHLALGFLFASVIIGRAADPATDLLAGRSKACPKCNLAGAHLKRFDLKEADLAGANLARANLTGANLNKTDLTRANLAGARLGEVMLFEADLSGADLSR